MPWVAWVSWSCWGVTRGRLDRSLSGAKQTLRGDDQTDVNDPNQTFPILSVSVVTDDCGLGIDMVGWTGSISLC